VSLGPLGDNGAMADPSPERALLDHLGTLAAELGPMLAPAGHQELLASIADTARSMFSAGACSLALLDEEQTELTFHYSSGGGDVIGTRVAVGEGIAGWVVASGQSIVIDDVNADPRFARDVAEQTGYVPRSIMAMPLETQRDTLGVISVLDAKTARGGEELELLGLFARQAALAIESHLVFADLARTLFAAAARASVKEDLASALQALAEDSPSASADLAELAAAVSRLSRAGAAERATGRDLVRVFSDYVDGRHR
jgi:GAF domain-containing protein